MRNNWTTIVALSQQENRGPNRVVGFEKIEAETPERAMIPSNEFIYIYRRRKSRREGTVDGAAREERPPAVWVPPPGNARTEGGGRGEDKTGGFFFRLTTKQSEPDRSLGACFSLRGLQRRSCEKQVVREGVSRKHPSRNRSGILSVEDGTQALEKLRLNNIFGLAGENKFSFWQVQKRWL